MKKVKIILYILIGLTIIFLSTGLIVKENSYAIEVEVNKPIEDTFKIFDDESIISNWIPEIKKIESIEEKPGVTGSTYLVTMDNNGQTVTMREKILAYIANEKITLYFDAEGVFKTDDYKFESIGDKTKITLDVSYEGKSYLLNCIFPYFKGTFKGLDAKYLNNFKQYVEKQ